MSIYNDVKKLNIQQFQDAENFNKILQIFSHSFDELDIVFNDLKNILNITDSVGKQLDLIGDIIVEKRNGADDNDYRAELFLKIFENTSRAFVIDIVNILTIITNATKVVYSDNPPASYTIYTNGQILPSNINKIIDNLSGAGISVLIYASDGEIPFIATEVQTTTANLQTNNGDNIIDNLGNDLIVNYESEILSDELQNIFDGKGFGVVETLELITNTGDVLITNTGATISVYDGNENIIDGGLANLAYQ